MHEPRVVFMNEPTVGADVEARSRLLSVVRALTDEGAAVVYTSHYLAEFEELGADITVLDEGRIVAHGSLEQIIHEHAKASIVVTFAEGAPDVDGWRRTERGLESVVESAEPSTLDILLALAFVQVLYLVGCGIRFHVRNVLCSGDAVHGGPYSPGLRRRIRIVPRGFS